MANFVTLFEDTFQRANENPLSDGGNWTDPGIAHPLQVLSNACAPTNGGAGGSNYAKYTGSLPNDQFAQGTLGSFNAANFPVLDLWVRTFVPASPSNTQGYDLRMDPGTQLSFQLRLEPQFTLLMSQSNLGAANVGDVYMLAAQGTLLSVYRNGSLLGSVTDSTYSSGTAMLALFAQVSATDIVATDFQAGTVAAYSQPDCRTVKPNSATSEVVQGTLLYDKQTSSNSAIPPTDSRTNKPVDSRASNAGTTPVNSRNPNKYNQ